MTRVSFGLLVATSVLAFGCSSTHDDDSTDERNWLSCDSDGDCEAKVSGSHCGSQGVCVDAHGERVVVPNGGDGSSALADGGASGSGASGERSAGRAGSSSANGGSGGSGQGVDDGGQSSGGTGGNGQREDGGPSSGSGGANAYEPCGGKLCGDDCHLCAPDDPACSETDEVKRCDATGTCTGSLVLCTEDAGAGVLPDCAPDDISCSGSTVGPIAQCCSGATLMRCEYDACVDALPPACTGVYQPVPLSSACTGGYDPCAGKSCGDRCSSCAPFDPDCIDTDVVRTCDQFSTCVPSPTACPF